MQNNVPLKVLNVLIVRRGKYLTTKELAGMVQCERKAIYNAIDALETNGFHIDVRNRGHKKGNEYRLGDKIYAFSL